MYYKSYYKSEFGEILLASNETSIIGLWIGEEKYLDSKLIEDMIEEEVPILKEGKRWLDDYFAGKKPEASRLQLSPIGGEFRQEVWKILLEIPYGKLTTYRNIANEVKKRLNRDKMSAQAIGGAVGHNPISIIIPCHRVVGANGSLVGYAGGLELKISLLEHEEVDMSGLFIPKRGSAL